MRQATIDNIVIHNMHQVRLRLSATHNLYRAVVLLCWIAGAFLLVASVRLARSNRQLAAQIAAYYRSIELPVGVQVPRLLGFDRTGSEITVDSDSRKQPTLVLVFSPLCPVCDDNWPQWDALVNTQRLRGGNIVAVDITGSVAETYLQVHGIAKYPVVDSIAPEAIMAYRFRFTPQTLIIADGALVGGWTGMLTDANVARAIALLTGEEGVDGPIHQAAGSVADGGGGANGTIDQVLLPACDGAPCSEGWQCGSKCTCEGATDATLGTCVAKTDTTVGGSLRLPRIR